MLIHGGPTGRWTDATVISAGLSFWHLGDIPSSVPISVVQPAMAGHFWSRTAPIGAEPISSDVLAGVDDLIARGIVDPVRLGIAGWSYGGYMSAWAITQTPRFKAAVVGAGMSDLASEFGTESLGSAQYDHWFYGVPLRKAGRLHQELADHALEEREDTHTDSPSRERSDRPDRPGATASSRPQASRRGMRAGHLSPRRPRSPGGKTLARHQPADVDWFETHLK